MTSNWPSTLKVCQDGVCNWFLLQDWLPNRLQRCRRCSRRQCIWKRHPPRCRERLRCNETILRLRPEHAPALINLGTIQYNRRDYELAETLYRRATLADPEYALAFFDLGNVLDELQRLPEATTAYERAVALVPQYADAHYNLALAYERQDTGGVLCGIG